MLVVMMLLMLRMLLLMCVDVVLYVHCDVINDVGYDNGDAMCCVDCVEVVVVDCVIVVGLCC